MCSSLPGFHAITGCDSTSSLAGIGKKKAWDSFCRSTDHQDSLSLLGEEQGLNVTAAGKCEAYGLQPIYSIQEDKHRRWAALPHVLPEKAEKRNASTDVWLSASTSKAVKLPGIRVEACSWSDARSWATRGSWMGEGRRASCTIVNHKRTSTWQPSQADDVQVQDVYLLAKLLLQQHRTCLLEL